MADAEKCFDKLWLKDCLVDMKEEGLRDKEVALIYELNKKANIVIETPAGKTKEIKVSDIVKQGTVFGPQLCCINTSKVNEINEKNITVITPKIKIEALVYVDDIIGIGSKENIEIVGRNLAEMEKRKKYTFNNGNGKSHYMMIKTGVEPEEEVEIKVEKGKIEKTVEYKYLGNWINEKGTVERQVKEIRSKIKGMALEAKRIGHEKKTGNMSTDVIISIYEKTIIPAILYNLEVWTNWRKKDWEEMEKVQAEALKIMFDLPISTPYWGMLAEFGIWTMRKRVMYKKMSLYHNIINSKGNRLSKQVIEEQIRTKVENGWYKEVERDGEEIEIDVTKVKEYTKEQWKNMIKEKINKMMEKESKEKRQKMKKLAGQRQQKHERQMYTIGRSRKEVTNLLKTKIQMWDIGGNLGAKRKCYACEMEETENHIMNCKKVKEIITRNIEIDILSIKTNVEEKTKFFIEYINMREKQEKKKTI